LTFDILFYSVLVV